MPLRQPICAWASCALLAIMMVTASASVAAQAWKPQKPVEIIIGTSPGGPQDRTGRIVQKILQDKKLVSAPINVVNRPGGGGAVALSYLNQHSGDAHYLLINAMPLLSNHITGKSPFSYTDITPIAILGVEYVGLSVRVDSPIKDGRDLIAQLRKDPGSLSVAIGTALGNATHLSFALAMKAAGVDIKKLKTVVFNSGSESITAALGGHIDVAASAPSSALPQLRAGKMRMLVIGAPQRMPGELAGVPTWRELGINSAFELWRGLAGPRGLSRAQVQFWDDALAKLVQTDEWKKDLERNDMIDAYRNSAESARHWKAEYEEVKAVLTELGLAK
ncbi:MAG TPA: tripartite tricarboxylate transporter substrate binding protein [Burkholderiales bacterium]|nr:tripartite tricarboxylate transporter substrate binding protein [Burkholderiales bacterium]